MPHNVLFETVIMVLTPERRLFASCLPCTLRINGRTWRNSAGDPWCVITISWKYAPVSPWRGTSLIIRIRYGVASCAHLINRPTKKTRVCKEPPIQVRSQFPKRQAGQG